VIKLENITVERNETQILNSVDLNIMKGECVVLTGPSGGGKTSILKTLAGALSPDSGVVTVDGVELSAASAPSIRSKIAFIGQEPVMGAEIVRDALLMPFEFDVHKGACPNDDYIGELLASVGLDREILNKKSSDISGGQKQRIAIIRALLLSKSIILADEFTSALDPGCKQQVIDLLLNGDNTILSVSHDRDWMSQCGRIIKVDGGKIAGEDSE